MIFYIDPFDDLHISGCGNADDAAGLVALIGTNPNVNNYFVAELVAE